MKRLILAVAVLVGLTTPAWAEFQSMNAIVSVTTTVKKVSFRDNHTGGTWAYFHPMSVLVRSDSLSAETCFVNVQASRDAVNAAAKSDIRVAAGEGFEFRSPDVNGFNFFSVVCPTSTATFYVTAQGNERNTASRSFADVVWGTPDAGVTVTGSSLAKSGTGGATGVTNVRRLASGDGYVQFTVTETDTLRAFGLDASAATHTDASIDSDIRLLANGTYAVLENNVSKATGNSTASDVWRIEIISGTLYYKLNGLVKWTSAAAVSYPLYLVTDLNTDLATITSAKRDLDGDWVIF